MKAVRTYGIALAVMAAAVMAVGAQTTKVDLSKEVAGKPPAKFQAMVGTWVVVKDGAENVIKIDGAAWKAAQTPATKMLIENARKLYGTNNEELMDNAKQFAYYPVAVLNSVKSFSNGTISVQFKTVGGDADRCSGILFNVKPNGDWLAVRYNDTEHNIALWEFHDGIRRRVAGTREDTFPLDRAAWHELSITVDGSAFKAFVDGKPALEYTLGTEPGPGRGGVAPNPDLFPANNPVLRPPVSGQVGLWSKTDSTSYFKDYIVSPK